MPAQAYVDSPPSQEELWDPVIQLSRMNNRLSVATDGNRFDIKVNDQVNIHSSVFLLSESTQIGAKSYKFSPDRAILFQAKRESSWPLNTYDVGMVRSLKQVRLRY